MFVHRFCISFLYFSPGTSSFSYALIARLAYTFHHELLAALVSSSPCCLSSGMYGPFVFLFRYVFAPYIMTRAAFYLLSMTTGRMLPLEPQDRSRLSVLRLTLGFNSLCQCQELRCYGFLIQSWVLLFDFILFSNY